MKGGKSMTINELLVMMKAVRERLNGLKSLRTQVSVEERTIFGTADREKITTPKYDPKVVDTKITQLEIWLYKADAAVKQSNAKTEVEVTGNLDELLAPLS